MMYDPYVTREMMVKDLLCHRCGLGLGAGDLMFWPATTLTREEIYIGYASSNRLTLSEQLMPTAI